MNKTLTTGTPTLYICIQYATQSKMLNSSCKTFSEIKYKRKPAWFLFPDIRNVSIQVLTVGS